jgi:hypothetical protein
LQAFLFGAIMASSHALLSGSGLLLAVLLMCAWAAGPSLAIRSDGTFVDKSEEILALPSGEPKTQPLKFR